MRRPPSMMVAIQARLSATAYLKCHAITSRVRTASSRCGWRRLNSFQKSSKRSSKFEHARASKCSDRRHTRRTDRTVHVEVDGGLPDDVLQEEQRTAAILLIGNPAA